MEILIILIWAVMTVGVEYTMTVGVISSITPGIQNPELLAALLVAMVLVSYVWLSCAAFVSAQRLMDKAKEKKEEKARKKRLEEMTSRWDSV